MSFLSIRSIQKADEKGVTVGEISPHREGVVVENG